MSAAWIGCVDEGGLRKMKQGKVGCGRVRKVRVSNDLDAEMDKV